MFCLQYCRVIAMCKSSIDAFVRSLSEGFERNIQVLSDDINRKRFKVHR